MLWYIQEEGYAVPNGKFRRSRGVKDRAELINLIQIELI